MSVFVAYKVRAIQKYITLAPGLKYVIGGSSLIDQFGEKAGRFQAESSAAGKGHFEVPTEEDAKQVVDVLRAEARGFGMDLAIGVGAHLPVVLKNQNKLYPFLPSKEDREGYPCRASAAFPTKGGKPDNRFQGVHETLRRRVEDQQGSKVRDLLETRLIEALEQHRDLPVALADYDKLFFSTLSKGADGDGDEEKNAPHPPAQGSGALGRRNRWAVIRMDGNQIGSHFVKLNTPEGDSEERQALAQRYLGMSKALEERTQQAVVEGLAKALGRWCQYFPKQVEEARFSPEVDGGRQRIVLPFRPLVLGGDDLTLLCHPSLAMDFVHTVIEEFGRHRGEEHLWPETRGDLSISAGVLFCAVTYPLHSAIEFAEELLQSAKFLGRLHPEKGRPPRPAIDWESVTEGLIDHPAARRQRELFFYDRDLPLQDAPAEREPRHHVLVKLSKRPYLLSQWPKLEEWRKLLHPMSQGISRDKNRTKGEGENEDNTASEDSSDTARGLIHDLYTYLRKPHYDRVVWLAKIRKNHPKLVSRLEEDLAPWGLFETPDYPDKKVLDSSVLDAALLAREEIRMTQETQGAK
jgi:hypothetical protein